LSHIIFARFVDAFSRGTVESFLRFDWIALLDLEK